MEDAINGKKYLVFFILLVLLTIFLFAHKINFTADDLGRHLANGRFVWENPSLLYKNFYSYTAQDFPFVNHHWLSGVVFYIVYKFFSFEGLVVFKLIIVLVTLYFLWRASLYLGGGGLTTALFSIPAILLWTERSAIRPEILSYLFLSLFIFLIARYKKTDKKRNLLMLLPIQLLWVNFHIYFFAGFLAAGFFLAEEWFRSLSILPRGRARIILLVFFGLIAVSLLNPNWLNGLVYPFKILNNYGYTIVENQSYFFMRTRVQNVHFYFLWTIIFLLALGFAVNYKRFNFWLFGLSAVFSVMAVLAIRNFALLALISVPSLSYNFSFVGNYFYEFGRRFRFKIYGAGVFLLIFAVFIFLVKRDLREELAYGSSFGLGLEEESMSSVKFFKDNNLRGPIFNNYDLGSYLIFSLYPKEKVFIDNRPEAYPPSFISGVYKAMQENDGEWEKRSQEYGINVIFFSHTDITPWALNFLALRLKDPQWPLVYADPYVAIFVKKEYPLAKFGINDNLKEYIENKMKGLSIKSKLNYANLLELAQKNREAKEILEDLLSKNGRDQRIKTQLALNLVNSSDVGEIEKGTGYLREIIARGNRLPGIRNQLGVALFRVGKFEAAKNAWREVLEDYPDEEAASGYLKQAQEFNTNQAIPLRSP